MADLVAARDDDGVRLSTPAEDRELTSCSHGCVLSCRA
jgi:hypothetical protein